ALARHPQVVEFFNLDVATDADGDWLVQRRGIAELDQRAKAVGFVDVGEYEVGAPDPGAINPPDRPVCFQHALGGAVQATLRFGPVRGRTVRAPVVAGNEERPTVCEWAHVADKRLVEQGLEAIVIAWSIRGIDPANAVAEQLAAPVMASDLASEIDDWLTAAAARVPRRDEVERAFYVGLIGARWRGRWIRHNLENLLIGLATCKRRGRPHLFRHAAQRGRRLTPCAHALSPRPPQRWPSGLFKSFPPLLRIWAPSGPGGFLTHARGPLSSRAVPRPFFRALSWRDLTAAKTAVLPIFARCPASSTEYA